MKEVSVLITNIQGRGDGMVILTEYEKSNLCDILVHHLPRIRELLGITQAELGDLCGLSRARISQLESGRSRMRWGQWMAIMYLCTVNRRTKDFLYINNLYSVRIFQYLQRLDENVPPDQDMVADYGRLDEIQAELARAHARLGGYRDRRMADPT